MSTVVSFDRSGTVLSVDDGFSSLLGYSTEEIVGKTLQKTILNDTESVELTAILEEIIRGNKSLELNKTTELIHKNRSTVPAHISTLIFGEGNTTIFAYQISMWLPATSLITFHFDGTILGSSNGESIFQYSDNEIVQMKFYDLVPNLKTTGISTARELKEKIEKTPNIAGKRRDGAMVPLGIQMEILEVGPISICRGKLRKLDLSKEAIFIVDRNETVLDSNADFVSEIFGYPHIDVMGTPLSKMVGFRLPQQCILPEEEKCTKRQKIDEQNRSNGSFNGQSGPPATTTFVHRCGNEIRVTVTMLPLIEAPTRLLEKSNALPFYAFRIRRVIEETRLAPKSDSDLSINPDLSKSMIDTRMKVGNYYLGSKIGEGANGTVVSATHCTTNEKAVVKILDKSAMKAEDIFRALREAEILKQLNHPNIVRALEVVNEEDTLYMFMESVTGGDLKKKCLNGTRTPVALRRKLFSQICEAINYCHSRNIIHRDIKHSNILLTPSGEIKLIDFGLSNFCEDGTFLTTFCGSLAYAAPEMLLGSKYIGPEVDVWSLGVILFSMMTGTLPFVSVKDIIAADCPEINDVDDKSCLDLVHKMLVLDVSKRIHLKDVLAHPWVVQADAEIQSTATA